jgi:5'-deoxynucleotidase
VKTGIDNLFEVVRGGTIKRYHTLETIGEQSVGAHSWGVAIILQYLEPNVSKIAILKALTHDVAELYTGDIPAPVKWDNPDLVEVLKRIEDKYESDIGIEYELTPQEIALGKQADMFELLVFCVRQRRLGNTNMNEVFSNGVEYLASINLNSRGKELLGYLTKIYGGI